jgi:hypothetical protein
MRRIGRNLRLGAARAIGVPWYVRQDYSRLLAIMEDADVLPPRYDQWLQRAERFERDRLREGQIVVRAIIDPQNFPAWCAARGLNVDAKGRAAFAGEEARRHVGQTH